MGTNVGGWCPWTDELRQALVDILGEDGVDEALFSEDNVKGRPSPQALDSLEKAIQLDKENSEVLFAYCRALAEVLRQNESIPQDEPISFGTKRTFGNGRHMRNYIFDQCSRLFELDPISIKYNLGVALFCTSTLPYWARSHQLAKLCLERALIFHPESGKALTRMGLFKLTVDKDITSARAYFKQANGHNAEDFGAATSLLYSIFADIESYKGQIHVILKTEFQKPFWNDQQRATLYFIRGLFQFFYESFEKNVAVSWILAFTLSENELEACLERFPRIKTMYRFPVKYDEVFTLTNFCDALKDSSSYPEVDKQKLKALRTLIKVVGRKHLKELTGRAVAKSSIDQNHAATTGGKNFPQKKPPGTSYASLENVTVGSRDNVGEAYEVFRVAEKTPKSVIISKYRQVCRELESIKKQPECDQREIANQMFEYNSAFATLHRYFDRQAREIAIASAAAAANPEIQDSSNYEEE